MEKIHKKHGGISNDSIETNFRICKASDEACFDGKIKVSIGENEFFREDRP